LHISERADLSSISVGGLQAHKAFPLRPKPHVPRIFEIVRRLCQLRPGGWPGFCAAQLLSFRLVVAARPKIGRLFDSIVFFTLANPVLSTPGFVQSMIISVRSLGTPGQSSQGGLTAATKQRPGQTSSHVAEKLRTKGLKRLPPLRTPRTANSFDCIQRNAVP